MYYVGLDIHTTRVSICVLDDAGGRGRSIPLRSRRIERTTYLGP